MTRVQPDMPPAIRDISTRGGADFIVRAGRAMPRFYWSQFAFGAVAILFAVAFSWQLLGPLLLSGSTRFEENGEPVVATWDHLSPLAVPVLVSALFLVVGVLLVTFTWREQRAGPAWFAGTADGLVRVRGEEVRTMPWTAFTLAQATATHQGSVRFWKFRWFRLNAGLWIATPEGRVWTLRGMHLLYIPDVPDPMHYAQLCQARIDAALGKPASKAKP